MKTKGLLTYLFLILLFNGISNSSIKVNNFDPGYQELLAENSETLSKQEIQNKAEEEFRSYYREGLELYESHQYIPAETAFLKAIKLAEKSNDKEILAFSFHHLGNIESWKSNFEQSIYYHRKARDLFLQLNNSEYEAISNNQISFAFESLGEYDSSLLYYQINIQNRALIEGRLYST